MINDKSKLMEYNTLVISGGGLKGIMSLGALYYLNSKKLLKNIKTICATSVGTIIGYLMILGYDPIDIFAICFREKIFSNIEFCPSKLLSDFSLSSINKFVRLLEELTLKKTGKLFNMKEIYDYFGIEFILSTYNITNTKMEYICYKTLPNLPVLTAIRMSSNVPILFEKFEYNGCLYVDGGICDNFPIGHVSNKNNKIIGINTISTNFNSTKSHNLVSYIINVLFTPVQILYNKSIQNITPNIDVIHMDKHDISGFNFMEINQTKLFESFLYGYDTTKSFFNKKSYGIGDQKSISFFIIPTCYNSYVSPSYLPNLIFN